MLDKLAMYLQYPNVRYALIVGVLVALCSSLLGVTLVLKRLSLIGDGLSHVAFSMLALATVLKLTAPMLFVLPVTVAPPTSIVPPFVPTSQVIVFGPTRNCSFVTVS